MNETHVKKCQRCGNALPSDAPQGLCPRCLGRLNFATDTALPDAEVVAAQPPLSPQEIAPHFPQLEILECLGRGGMGVVYKARQKSLNRVVALKLLAPERVQDETFAERFAREAQALARLSHPHIVTVHDFGQAGGFFYLIMEFVDGVNLGQLLAASRLSPHEALAIVPQICDALQYAHDQGIFHRDIKPENILMDRQGRVKVADFGLAKLVGAEVNGVALSPGGRESGQRPGAVETPALTEAGKVMGTPSYMAPEQQERPAAVDHRADIYALGVVFYQMLTGELPGKRLEPPSKKVLIDVRLDEVVLRALEKEPERRYQQVSQVKTAVEMIVSSRAQEPTELVPKLRWRDRWLWDTHNGFAWVLKAVLAVFALLLVPLLLPFLLWPPVIGGVMGFIAIYGWVGHRIRMLKAALPPGEAEVAEGWLAWPQGMWPFNRSQGLAILHDDRLELVPVWYVGTHTIPLADITSVRQAHWVYVPLVWKHGLELELANGQRVSLAVPEPIGRRWQALLSREKPSAVPALSEADLSAVRQQLQTPATGLMVAGALTFVPAVILAAAMMVGFVLFPLLALAEGLPDTIGWRKILFMLLASAWALPGFLVWLGARRMTRLQDRGWALAASLVAMITPPGCLVGLPFGIWALVVLNRPAV
jgi:tRNA A-37 threonylcarbamoyl transferase component Bud32